MIIETPQKRTWTTGRSVQLIFIFAFACITIFFIDLRLSMGATISILYTGAVWMIAEYPERKALFPAALICSFLTILGLVLSPPGIVPGWIILLNRGLSLFVIWITVGFLYQRKAFELSTTLLSNLAARTPNGAFVCDLNGTLSWMNKGFELLTDIRTENVGKMNLSDLNTDLKSRGSLAEALEAISQGKSEAIDPVILKAQDRQHWVRLELEPLYDSFGKLSGSFGLMVDVSEAAQHQAELTFYLDYANSIVQSLTKALVVIDNKFVIDIGNTAARKLFNIGEDDTLTGKKLNTLLEEPEAEQLIVGKFTALQLQEETSIAFEATVNSRQYIVTMTRLSEMEGLKQKYTLSFFDISEYKETLRSLENTNDELKQFAYVASHDLQEPLRKISSFLQILEEDHKDKLPDDARECIDFAVDGANRLKGLIQDLLSFTGLSRSRAIEFARVDCNEVVETVLLALDEFVEENNATVVVEDLAAIAGQRSQIEQLFQNLIVNGIKYTLPDATPKVTISCSWKQGMVQFTIKDNGIGIEQQYDSKIFRIFQRLHSKDEYPGTGIGLAICKRIVLAHGGKIWFTSEPGKGSEFHFTLRAFRE